MTPASPPRSPRCLRRLSSLLVAGTLAVGVASVPAAPVVPNESRVTGEVLQAETVDAAALGMAPPQPLCRLRLRLVTVRDAGSRSNFLRGKEGEVVEVYSKEALPAGAVGRLIRGTVAFRGDERGGRYWMSEIAVASP